MITYKSAGIQQSDVLIHSGSTGGIPNFLSGVTAYATSQGLQVLDEDFNSANEVAFRISHLSQGKYSFGKLRDKDVFHTHVDGELVTSHYVAASERWWPKPDYPSHGEEAYVVGRVVFDQTSESYWMFGPISTFGESSSSRSAFTLPGGPMAPYFGEDIFLPTGGWVDHQAVYEADVHMLATKVSALDFKTDDGHLYYHKPEAFLLAVMYLRDRSTAEIRRVEFALDVGGGLFGQDGQIYQSLGDVPLDYDLWVEYSEVIAPDSWRRYTDLFDPEVVTRFPYSYSELNDRLRHDLAGTFPQVLRMEIDTFDPDTLTTGILSQFTVTKSSILLDFFQLDAGKLLSTSWKNFFKLSKDVSQLYAEGKHLLYPNLRKTLKSLLLAGTGTFLGVKYGVLPNIRDVEDVWKSQEPVALMRMDSNRLHSRSKRTGTPAIGSLLTTDTLTVEVDRLARDFLPLSQQLIAAWHKFGMFPDLRMAWDAIPFSFVLGWFTSVGDTVESLNTRIWRDYYPIQYAITGRKEEWNVACSDLWPDIDGLDGSVVFTRYDRRVIFELPYPPIDVTSELDGSNHSLEAMALVAQFLR